MSSPQFRIRFVSSSVPTGNQALPGNAEEIPDNRMPHIFGKGVDLAHHDANAPGNRVQGTRRRLWHQGTSFHQEAGVFPPSPGQAGTGRYHTRAVHIPSSRSTREPTPEPHPQSRQVSPVIFPPRCGDDLSQDAFPDGVEVFDRGRYIPHEGGAEIFPDCRTPYGTVFLEDLPVYLFEALDHREGWFAAEK